MSWLTPPPHILDPEKYPGLHHMRGRNANAVSFKGVADQVRSQGEGGRSGLMSAPPRRQKVHFSADCSSANILNIVRLWNRIKIIKSRRLTT